MPRRKKCGSLYSVSLKATAKQLLQGCEIIDSKTEPFSQYNKIRGKLEFKDDIIVIDDIAHKSIKIPIL